MSAKDLLLTPRHLPILDVASRERGADAWRYEERGGLTVVVKTASAGCIAQVRIPIKVMRDYLRRRDA